MAWHQKNTVNAAYTFRYASASRPVCAFCVYGSMRQTNTDHRRQHREQPTVAGQQFSLDAYTHTSLSYRRSKYCDLLTDLATGQIFPLFTKDRSSEDICHQLTIFLVAHTWWKDPAILFDRFIRVDSEKCYRLWSGKWRKGGERR